MSINWVDIKLKNAEEQNIQVGPLRIFIRKVHNEVWIAYEYSSAEKTGASGTEGKDTEPKKWIRWALKEDITGFSLFPCFPDRPIVVKPEYPFKISKGASARIYSRVPVFVRITPKDYPDFVITEIPTVVLSNTWFGSFTEGELCYWLSTTARREINPEIFESHMAVCTMQIKNNSDEELKFENICLRVDRLSLYLMDEFLWADQTDITYQGGDKHTDIEMKGRLPKEAKGGKLITKPRTPIQKSFAIRTFQFFKEIQGIGLN